MISPKRSDPNNYDDFKINGGEFCVGGGGVRGGRGEGREG